MANIPGQGMVASSAGSTTSEASTIEVQESGVTSPPLGLTPLDFTNWSLPLLGGSTLHRLGDYPYPPAEVSVDKLQAHGPWVPGP